MGLFASEEEIFPRDTLKGNAELKTYFAELLESRRLPHAHILEGPDGSGRHTLVYAVAEALARLDGCDENMIDRIRARQSPDVLEYGLSGSAKSIGIDTVRAIKEAAYIVPSELEFKLFIIDDAHLLTVQAQNALLKLLEEPPYAVYFMLLCGNIANILTTVRSRAPALKLELFDEVTLDKLLCEDKKLSEAKKRSSESYAAAIRAAAGSYGAARTLLSSRSKKSVTDIESVRELLRLLETTPSQVVLYSSKLPSKREELYELMSEVLSALRDLALLKRVSEPRLLYYLDRETAELDAERFTLRQLVKFADTTSELMRAVDSNVNINGATLAWLDSLARAAMQ